MQKPSLFEYKTSSEACQTCKIIRYIQPWQNQNSLLEHFQGYLGIFRDIDAYSAILTDAQLGGEGMSPLLCLKMKKVSWFWKERP